jgi:gluconate kinase
MPEKIKISCLNCSQFCQNNDRQAFLDMIEEIKTEGGGEQVVVECEILKRSFNL